MKKLLLGAACALSLLNFGCAATGQATNTANTTSSVKTTMTFKQEVEALLKATKVPGASVAVIQDYQVIDAFGVGVRAYDTENPEVTVDTPFQAASISKVVVAAATLQLIELESLALDTVVNDRLKYWHIPAHPWFKGDPVTVEDLLSHTGGINVGGFGGYQADSTLPNIETILDGIPPANSNAVQVYRRPGVRFRYSGGGYQILQKLLMDVRGAEFPNIMVNAILDPLEMTRSTYRMCLAEHCTQKVAWGHQISNGKAEMVAGEFYDYPESAAAGLWTTASDLAKFVVDIQKSLKDGSGQILTQKMAKDMTTRTVETDLFESGAAWEGIGVFLCNVDEGEEHDAGKDDYFFHPGQNTGFLSQFFAHKTEGYGIIILSNAESTEFIDGVTRIAAERFGFEPGYKNCEFGSEQYDKMLRIPRRDPW